MGRRNGGPRRGAVRWLGLGAWLCACGGAPSAGADASDATDASDASDAADASDASDAADAADASDTADAADASDTADAADASDASDAGDAGDSGADLVVPIVEDCEVPAAPADGSYHLSEGLTYSSPGGDAQRLDVAWPLGGGSHPLVVVIHGGGWRSGNRGGAENAAIRTLASLGYAAATIDYRLAPDHPFPAAIADARCAVRWLRAHAAEYGIDVARVAAWGRSAGAHLAELLAFGAALDGLDDGTCLELGSPSVDALVAYYGPSDLRDLDLYGPGGLDPVIGFLGAHPDDVPALASLASPIVHVDGVDPPTFLAHGLDDGLVLPAHSERLHAALLTAGVRAGLVELPGVAHGIGFFDGARPEVRPAVCTTVAFLEAELAP